MVLEAYLGERALVEWRVIGAISLIVVDHVLGYVCERIVVDWYRS